MLVSNCVQKLIIAVVARTFPLCRYSTVFYNTYKKSSAQAMMTVYVLPKSL